MLYQYQLNSSRTLILSLPVPALLGALVALASAVGRVSKRSEGEGDRERERERGKGGKGIKILLELSYYYACDKALNASVILY